MALRNEMAENIIQIEPKRKYTPTILTRSNLYSRYQKLAPRAIQVMSQLLKSNSNMIRYRAASDVLNRTIPPLRNDTGNGNTFNITVNMGNGYKPLSDSSIIDTPIVNSNDSNIIKSIEELPVSTKEK